MNRNIDISYGENMNNLNNIDNLYNNLYNILLNNILDLSLENNNNDNDNEKDYKKVATQEEIDNIDKIIFNKNDAINRGIPLECPINYIDFSENEVIYKLKCNHYFSKQGIIRWLSKESNLCPVCRYKFNYKLIKKNNKDSENREINLDEGYNELFNNNIIDDNRDIYVILNNENRSYYIENRNIIDNIMNRL